MSTAAALARTLLLMRRNLRLDVDDGTLLDALASTSVRIVADTANASSHAGQSAIVTTALLCARSGAEVVLDVPDVPLVGPQPPLGGEGLRSALIEVGADLLPRVTLRLGRRVSTECVVAIGDTRTDALTDVVFRIEADAWSGRLSYGRDPKPIVESFPLGALAAAGLAAGEVYKHAMRKLRPFATHEIFDEFFARTTAAELRLGPILPVPTSLDVGRVDMISAGAITHAALYALSRVSGLRASVRAVDDQTSDFTNANRYPLLLRSQVGQPKVDTLARQSLGGLTINPVALRYEEASLAVIGPLAPLVLVGVDDIPTRWLVQRECDGWLAVGATADYFIQRSFHARGLACAGCLHRDDGVRDDVPTVAFVSHMAGLELAALLVRRAAAPLSIDRREQVRSRALLRPEASVWEHPVQPRHDCPVTCDLARAA